MKVLIADDHTPTRQAVRMALEEGGFEVVGESATAPGAIDVATRLKPDVALLDIHMPGNGITAAVGIASAVPSCAVVMLTVSRDDADLFDALRAGARGYLLKDIDPLRLPLALQGVLDGEAAMPRALVAKLIDEFRGRDAARPAGPMARLTSREWEVLDLMRQGLTTAEIASRLFMAPVTVRTHVAAILRKLQVGSRAEAIKLADG